MTTANGMIERAMRLTGSLGISETLSAAEASDGLDALNTMLDSWSTESLFVYVLSEDAIPVVANTASYTIGPTGSFVGVRPVEVSSSSYLVISGVSYPLSVLTTAEYNGITLKTQNSAIPQAIWYNPTHPNGTITLFPVPNQSMTLRLWSQKVLQSFPALTTEIALPPGYKRAIELSLAEEYAPEFSGVVGRTLAMKAAAARKNIKRINFRPQFLQAPASVLSAGPRFNINTGLSQ